MICLPERADRKKNRDTSCVVENDEDKFKTVWIVLAEG
jgi:hypothetical protein